MVIKTCASAFTSAKCKNSSVRSITFSICHLINIQKPLISRQFLDISRHFNRGLPTTSPKASALCNHPKICAAFFPQSLFSDGSLGVLLNDNKFMDSIHIGDSFWSLKYVPCEYIHLYTRKLLALLQCAFFLMRVWRTYEWIKFRWLTRLAWAKTFWTCGEHFGARRHASRASNIFKPLWWMHWWSSN